MENIFLVFCSVWKKKLFLFLQKKIKGVVLFKQKSWSDVVFGSESCLLRPNEFFSRSPSLVRTPTCQPHHYVFSRDCTSLLWFFLMLFSCIFDFRLSVPFPVWHKLSIISFVIRMILNDNLSSRRCPICGMTYDRKHKMADHLSSVHCMWQSSNLEFKSEDFYNMDVVCRCLPPKSFIMWYTLFLFLWKWVWKKGTRKH